MTDDKRAMLAQVAAAHETWALEHGDEVGSEADADLYGDEYREFSADVSAPPAVDDPLNETLKHLIGAGWGFMAGGEAKVRTSRMRDDGALLVIDGSAAALVVDGEVAYLPVAVEAARLADLRRQLETGQPAVVAARALWTGCAYCLNPRHPGPCAKPGSKAYIRRHGKAAVPKGGGGAGPGSGKDLVGENADVDSVATSINDAVAATPQVRGDNVLRQISARQGFDGKPEVVSRAEFEQRIKQPGHVEMHRGISNGTDLGIRGNDRPPAELAQDFRSGDMYQGFGMYANGTWAAAGSSGAAAAAKYAGANGTVLRMALKPGARTVEYHAALDEHDAFRASNRSPQVRQAFGNVSHYAAAAGYDAIVRHIGSDQTHYVILNRTALVVQEA